jgi:hypothetical protein
MCQRCNFTGWIIYGTDTETGNEKIKCNCECCDIKWKKETKIVDDGIERVTRSMIKKLRK